MITEDEARASPSYPIVALPPAFRDERGLIQNLFLDGAQSGAIITSRPGTRRADHFHKIGGHLCVLLSGRILYKYRKHAGFENTLPPMSVEILPGMAFYTPPGTDHSMEFTEDSCFLSFDPKVSRTSEGYANDTVKLPNPLI